MAMTTTITTRTTTTTRRPPGDPSTRDKAKLLYPKHWPHSGVLSHRAGGSQTTAQMLSLRNERDSTTVLVLGSRIQKDAAVSGFSKPEVVHVS